MSSNRTHSTPKKSYPKNTKLRKKQHLRQFVADDLTLVDFLSQHPLFSKLAKRDKTAAASLFDVVTYNAGEIVLRKGEHGDRILIVASGSLIENRSDVVDEEDENFFSECSFDDISLLDEATEGSTPLLHSKNSKEIRPKEVYGITSLIHSAYIWQNNVFASNNEEITIVLSLHRATYLEASRKHRACIHNLKVITFKAEQSYYEKCLKKLPFFKGFPQDFFQNLSKARYFEFEAIDEYEAYIKKGDMVSEFYVLLSGELVVADKEEDGITITDYGRIRPMQFFGVIPKFIHKTDAKKYVEEVEESLVFYRTLKKSTVLKIKLGDLKQICIRTPTLESRLTIEKIRVETAEKAVEEISLFSNINKSWRKYLIKNFQLLNLQPGHKITKKGEYNKRRFCIIVEGIIDVCVDGKLLKSLHRGDYFGENSLLADSTSTASLTVSTKHGLCKCLVLHGSAFLSLLEYEPSVKSELMFRIYGYKCEFQYLVTHPYLKRKFLEFVEKEQADESVHFLARVSTLEQMDRIKTKKVVLRSFGLDVQAVKSKKVNKIRSLALDIYNEFFSGDILNISSDVRKGIDDRFDSNDYGHTNVFSSAKSALLSMLDFDKYGRFKKTKVFEEFLEGIGVYM